MGRDMLYFFLCGVGVGLMWYPVVSRWVRWLTDVINPPVRIEAVKIIVVQGDEGDL